MIMLGNCLTYLILFIGGIIMTFLGMVILYSMIFREITQDQINMGATPVGLAFIFGILCIGIGINAFKTLFNEIKDNNKER